MRYLLEIPEAPRITFVLAISRRRKVINFGTLVDAEALDVNIALCEGITERRQRCLETRLAAVLYQRRFVSSARSSNVLRVAFAHSDRQESAIVLRKRSLTQLMSQLAARFSGIEPKTRPSAYPFIAG